MPDFLSRSGTGNTNGQQGFTLIEMLVVVGIIAILAAVIVPNIGKFIGAGDQGAKNAEWDSVQTAMTAMMSDNAVIAVSALAGNSTATWDALPEEVSTDPGVVPLYGAALADSYLQENPTAYFYCYDSNGRITRQDELAIAC